MRVKFKTGNSFELTTAYILGATKNQKPTILAAQGIELQPFAARKIHTGNCPKKYIRKIAKYIGYSFDIQAQTHPLPKPVRHYIVTFPPEDTEILERNELLVEIVAKYMLQIGISNTQYIVVRHNNTKHPHVHIVFNPIDNDFNVIRESDQFHKNERICKRITKEYSLHFSNPRNVRTNLEKLPKHDQIKAIMRKEVENALRTSDRWEDLETKLNTHNIEISYRRNHKNELIGIVFHRKTNDTVYHFKGSQLSRSLTVSKINKYLVSNSARIEEKDVICPSTTSNENILKSEVNTHQNNTRVKKGSIIKF